MKDDYDLSELRKIKVRGFEYNVMPRYLYHYTDQDYEQFSLDLLDRLLEEGGSAIDIGAHYGIYSLLAARKSKHVYAFEPVPENFEILKKNIEDNKLKATITPINKAVSDRKGSVEFNVTWASDSAGFYEHPNAEVIRKIKVDTNAIDLELKDVQDLSFIKIDTEGHEIHVLEGLRKTLKRNKNAKMLIELNPECLVNAGADTAQLIEKIMSLDYDVFALYEDERHMVKVEADSTEADIMQGRQYLNLLCLPRGCWQSMLFVSHSADMGGAERVLLGSVEGLIARKDTFVIPLVILPGEGLLSETIKKLPVAMQVVHMRGWTNTSLLSPVDREEVHETNSGAVVLLAKIYQDFKPGVACTNTMSVPWGAFVAKAFGIPHVWSLHEFGDIDHKLQFDYGYETSLRFIDKLSDKVIVNSKAVQEHVSRYIDDAKISLLYPQARQPVLSGKVASPYDSPKSLKLAIAGYVSPSKGQLDAVKALRVIRDKGNQAELVIVGPGSSDYIDQINQYVKRYKLEAYVHYVGYQDNPFNYLNLADIVLTCSDNEAFGLGALEAMSLGKVIIATASGGTPEIISDGQNGLLYKPHDTTELAQKIMEAAADPKLTQRISDEAKKTAKANTARDYADDLYKLLQVTPAKRAAEGEYALFQDLLRGMHSQLSHAKQNWSESANKHQEEIHNFSIEYNKVYAAYNEVSQQLTHLQRSKAVKLQNKVKGLKDKLKHKSG